LDERSTVPGGIDDGESPRSLEYYTPARPGPYDDVDEGEGICSRRALGWALTSLAATCAAIAVAEIEPPPSVRRLVLTGICCAGGAAVVGAMVALRTRLSYVDRSLVFAGIGLGALSIGATVMLF
jgi:hypothetical protein